MWQLVDARRDVLVGHVVPTSDGRFRTVTPARCPAGHSWDVGGVGGVVDGLPRPRHVTVSAITAAITAGAPW